MLPSVLIFLFPLAIRILIIHTKLAPFPSSIYKHALNQIRLRLSVVEKSVFNKNGHLEYHVMPLRLSNASTTFRLLMNGVLHGFIDLFHVVYIHDILIYSRTWEEHLMYIRAVLERLHNQELYLSPKQCSFMAKDTELL